MVKWRKSLSEYLQNICYCYHLVYNLNRWSNVKSRFFIFKRFRDIGENIVGLFSTYFPSVFCRFLIFSKCSIFVQLWEFPQPGQNITHITYSEPSVESLKLFLNIRIENVKILKLCKNFQLSLNYLYSNFFKNLKWHNFKKVFTLFSMI